MVVYKPPIQNYFEFTEEITKTRNTYVTFYETIFILEDFNMTTESLHLINLLRIFNPNVLIKAPTRYSHIIQNLKTINSQSKNHYLSC